MFTNLNPAPEWLHWGSDVSILGGRIVRLGVTCGPYRSGWRGRARFLPGFLRT